ncbi:MAG: tetratricopeptide repeat protein [Alysiella sp.]|uniref:tetratricopeptide repeat protein n=1 Tax=Alysiella sp. TaxID=1872483 RepID=UPI0026DD2A84|nr:tetratricopeptide repeat protein [Alysiella sp.]MDO4433658.1 tetratricopeptide repeat protein [Alysiella sp.]
MRQILYFALIGLTACTATHYPMREDVVLFNQADNIFLRNHQKLPEVLPIYTTLAEKGFTEAQFRLATAYEDLAYQSTQQWERTSYRQQSVYWYHKAAKNGHPIAQNNLALFYGVGVDNVLSQDLEQKFAWLQRAAQQGFATAQSNLGVMYHRGEYVAQDFDMADFWYRKAILQNYGTAKQHYENLLRDRINQSK